MSKFSLACCGLLLAVAAGPLFAQGTTPAKKVTTNEMVTTRDGWQIPITYYASTQGKEAPVVVLLHRRGSNRNEWKSNGLAEDLQNKGYAVIAVDLRQHGESKPVGGTASGPDALKARDFLTMVGAGGELEAVKDFVYKEHQAEKLNMAMMAIVAPGMSAPVAASWAANDWLKKPYNDAPSPAGRTPRGQDVKALILMSPEGTIPGVPITKPLQFLRNLPIAFLIMHGAVSDDERDAVKIEEQLTGVAGNKDRVFRQGYGFKLRGTDLMKVDDASAPPKALIVGFLEKHLKSSNIPWRDRRSRLVR